MTSHVVFSAPNKLSKLSRNVNQSTRMPLECTKKPQNRFVDCTEKVVYSIPLSCGKQYVGQTGRCLDDRLRKHCYDVNWVASRHLSIHCGDCRCDAELKKKMPCNLKKCQCPDQRDYGSRDDSALGGRECVSAPSVFLSAKKLDFLSRRLHAR